MSQRGETEGPRARLQRLCGFVLLVASSALLAGCQPPWYPDYGPTYSKPTRGGSPSVDHAAVVDALREEGFDITPCMTGMNLGLRRDIEVHIEVGPCREIYREVRAPRSVPGAVTIDGRVFCGVRVSVIRYSDLDSAGRVVNRPRRALLAAASAVRGVITRRCTDGTMGPDQLSDAIWDSDLDLEVRRQVSSQVYPPHLIVYKNGRWGEGDDGWSVSVRLFENTKTASEAMEQQTQDDEFGYDDHPAPPEQADLLVGNHYRACNTLVSFQAQLGYERENPFVASAQRLRDRAEKVAERLRDACEDDSPPDEGHE